MRSEQSEGEQRMERSRQLNPVDHNLSQMLTSPYFT